MNEKQKVFTTGIIGGVGIAAAVISFINSIKLVKVLRNVFKSL